MTFDSRYDYISSYREKKDSEVETQDDAVITSSSAVHFVPDLNHDKSGQLATQKF